VPRWIKGFVASALLVVLFRGVAWDELPQRLAQFSWITATIVVLAVAGQFVSSAWKWWCSLRLHDIELPFLFALKVLCIGFFFNNFLPSAIGGDAYRVYRTMKFSPDKFRALSAVLVERAVGLAVMLGLGFLCALKLADSNTLARTYVLLTCIGSSVGAIGLLALYLGWFKPITRRLRRFTWFSAIEGSAHSVLRIRSEWSGFLIASALFQLLAAVILYALLQAVGTELTMAQCMLIAAASGLASVLPVSINGIGVVEGTIAGTAVALGAEYEPALLAAIVLRILVLPANAVCGLLYLFDKQASQPAVAAN
jgi:uncharacterized membrane protein YbhN (UPF0104 family)